MSTTHGGCSADEWTPFIRYKSGVWLGQVGDVLYIGTESGPTQPVSPLNPVGLLPLLEFSYPEFLSEISRREGELDCDAGSILSLISPASLLATAVSMKSKYWTELALDWFDVLPVPKDIAAVLADLQNARWATQEIRHHARRQLA